METSNIIGNINVVFEKLFGSLEKDTFKMLDDIFVIDSKLIYEEPLKNILEINGINYMLAVANALIILYAIYYIINSLFCMYNGEQRESIFKFIIKLIVVGILTNFSIYLCETLMDINSSITYIIDGIASNVVDEKLDFTSLKDKIINIQEFITEDALSLNGIIKGMLSFGCVSVLLTFAVRYVTVIFLIFISPVAIICMSSDLTSGIFYGYIKVLIINLMIQNITKIVILLPLCYSNTSNLMYKIVMLGSIYLLYKITGFTKEIFEKVTSNRFGRGN